MYFRPSTSRTSDPSADSQKTGKFSEIKVTLRLSTWRRRPASCLLFEVLTQRAAARRMPQFADRLSFNLTHTFARDIKDPADFLKCAWVAGADPKTQTNNLRFALAQRGKNLLHFTLSEREAQIIRLRFGIGTGY